jgi:hypothetical protein
MPGVSVVITGAVAAPLVGLYATDLEAEPAAGVEPVPPYAVTVKVYDVSATSPVMTQSALSSGVAHTVGPVGLTVTP